MEGSGGVAGNVQMEGSGGVAGNVQEAANNLVDAAQGAVNSVADAGRGEAGTLLNAVGETLGHLQTLFSKLAGIVAGE